MSHKKDLREADYLAEPIHSVVIAIEPGIGKTAHIFIDGKELVTARDPLEVDFRVDDFHRVRPEILAEHIEVISIDEMKERLIKE